MKAEKLINLDRITCITIATKEDRIYLVFQDGRHNYGHRVKDIQHAQKALKTIERDRPKWWKVLGEPVEVTFKRQD
jgi:hypothetical protein